MKLTKTDVTALIMAARLAIQDQTKLREIWVGKSGRRGTAEGKVIGRAIKKRIDAITKVRKKLAGQYVSGDPLLYFDGEENDFDIVDFSTIKVSRRKRTPLFKHKQKLVEFLRGREAATRGEISSKTGIPPGSLSSLLKAKEFEQVRRGFWALKKEK